MPGNLFKWRQRALVVLITPLESSALEEGLLPVLPALTRHHRVVLASVRDPELEVLAATRTTIDEVYDAAASVIRSGEDYRDIVFEYLVACAAEGASKRIASIVVPCSSRRAAASCSRNAAVDRASASSSGFSSGSPRRDWGRGQPARAHRRPACRSGSATRSSATCT